jgi:1-phosphofructokinase family hexose kinase
MLIINPNPCFDRTLSLSNFARGAVMRGESAVVTAGGKGINVARAMRALGSSATLAVLIGEKDAVIYKNLLKDEGAEFIATTHPGIVRVATIIFEINNPTSTIINERGSEVSAKDWSAFVAEVAKNVKSGEIVSCMGSFPNGVSQESIEELIEVIHSVGGKIIFDSSPEFLSFALAAGVDIVSPNLDEAESLLHAKSADLFTGDLANAQERSEKAAKALLEKGASVAFVTTGAAGVAVATKSSLDFVHGVEINLVSAVGAGDSFVAGVMIKYDEYLKAGQEFNWRDIAAFGAATASASCEESLSGGINPARALELYELISNSKPDARGARA